MANKQMMLGVMLMVAYFGNAFGIPVLPEDAESGVKGGKSSEYSQKQETESVRFPTTTGSTTVRGSSTSSSTTYPSTTTTKTELTDVDLKQHVLSGENKDNYTTTEVTSTTAKSWFNIFKRDAANANSTESDESKSDEQQNPLIVPLRRKRWEEKSEEDASEKEGNTEEEAEEKEDSGSAETAEKEESVEEEPECPNKEHEESEEKEADEKEGKGSDEEEEEEEKDEKEEVEEAEESKEESEPEEVEVESIELVEVDDSDEDDD